MAELKAHKVVSALPSPLAANSVYYVRVGAGFDLYVTNDSGTVVAYALNQNTSSTELRYTREAILVSERMLRNGINAAHVSIAQSGTGAGAAHSSRTGDIGTYTLLTGTTTTGRAGILSEPDLLNVSTTGNGYAVEFVYEATTASDGTNTFTAQLGFLSTNTSATQTNGIYVDVAGSNAQAYVLSGTTVNTNTAIGAQTVGSLYRIRVEVKAGVVKFYHKAVSNYASAVVWPWVESDLKLTVSSGVPNNAGLGIGAVIVKSAGTSSRQLRVQGYLLSVF